MLFIERSVPWLFIYGSVPTLFIHRSSREEASQSGVTISRSRVFECFEKDESEWTVRKIGDGCDRVVTFQ